MVVYKNIFLVFEVCGKNKIVPFQLLVQNQMRKWNFQLNFRNGIN